MLNWSTRFSILLFLDSNSYPSAYEGYECLLAVAAGREAIVEAHTLEQLAAIHAACPSWLFGHITYDYRTVIDDQLASRHGATPEFAPLGFFAPQTVCYINRDCTTLTIESNEDAGAVYTAICKTPVAAIAPLPRLSFKRSVSKEAYINTIQALRDHIANGDCYEINYCTEGVAAGAEADPLQVFLALSKLSPAPFAAWYRLGEQYMMCASPERYICKQGNKIISQPIKGTARRGSDEATDAQAGQQLYNDIKERAENVMIVDLVRNDLARSCDTGSVQVDELFGIYTFPQVHQMISTVSGTLSPLHSFADAIRYSFPMGSMTGAPKRIVMQLIERYEQSGRGLFSGTVGYITPGGDMDFNVIIRSLFYDETARRISYQTGGAITWDSIPEQEWEEMRLKAWALERIFAE